MIKRIGNGIGLESFEAMNMAHYSLIILCVTFSSWEQLFCLLTNVEGNPELSPEMKKLSTFSVDNSVSFV